jgi:hypothetical protein
MDISSGADVGDLTVRPTGNERRRYNRRRPESEPPPPYFSVFERIADALEEVVGLLAVVASANTPHGPTNPSPGSDEPTAYPRPRESAQ